MNTILKILWNLVFKITGLDLSFDTKFGEWSFYLIELKANLAEVNKLLTEKHLTAKEITPGETKLQIIGCDMKIVQVVGPYHEVSIQVPVESIDASPVEKYAHLFLPVTTEAARWGGVDVDGFTKFLADIDIVKDHDQANCRLALQGELILEFNLQDHVGPERKLQWNFYGIRKQRIIKTTFDFEGLVYEEDYPSNSKLILGKHAISNMIRELLISEEIQRVSIGHLMTGIWKKPVYT
jgi:Acetoacetate decarboxylase (ADC)